MPQQHGPERWAVLREGAVSERGEKLVDWQSVVARLEVLTAQILPWPRVQGVHEYLGMDSGGCGRGQEPMLHFPMHAPGF